jgi:glycine cleavage system aminomethyltransferase T
VDLDKRARFIGQDALRRIADGTTRRRHAVAFTVDGDDMPDMETFWPVEAPGGERIGVVWQAGYSYALERYAGDALIDRPAAIGTPLELESPSGPIAATVVSRPLVPDAATEPRRN